MLVFQSIQGCDTLHQAVLDQNVEGVVFCITENSAILNKPLQVYTMLFTHGELHYKKILFMR